MATYPGPKVHRTNRRKLGRGQYPQQPSVSVVLTNPSTNVVELTFGVPVSVSGIIPVNTSTGILVSQQVSNSTTVLQTYNTSQAAATVSIAANAANVASYLGGGVSATSITF
jgi:hypothetical protein